MTSTHNHPVLKVTGLKKAYAQFKPLAAYRLKCVLARSLES